AHAFTVLTLRRSILTEKVSRRGYHLSREYAVDPLETLLVHDVMRTRVVALSATSSVDDLGGALKSSHGPGGQQLYPILDSDGTLHGTITRGDLVRAVEDPKISRISEMSKLPKVVAHPDESLRAVVYR